MAKKVTLGKYPNLKMVLSMAFTRTDWVNKVRQRLEGALGEYAKQKFSEAIGYSGWDWNQEVKTILNGILKFMDSKKVRTKVSFDRKKSFLEAYADAHHGYDQIVKARNDLANKHVLTPKQFQKLRSVKLDEEKLVEEMVQKFLPELLK